LFHYASVDATQVKARLKKAEEECVEWNSGSWFQMKELNSATTISIKAFSIRTFSIRTLSITKVKNATLTTTELNTVTLLDVVYSECRQ
jgi:hypothetical protein